VIRLLLRWPAWLAAALALVALAEWTRPPSWFAVNQLQLDYQLEFVRRGLVGEGLRILGVPRTLTTVWWMGWTFAAALAATSWMFFTRLVGPDKAGPSTARPDKAGPSTARPDPPSPSELRRAGEGASFTARANNVGPTTWRPLMWAFLLSPATFLQAGYDFGRLDAILIVLTMVLLLTVESGWEALGLDVVVAMAATLAHETFAVASAPFIAMCFLYVASVRPPLRTRLIVRAAVVLLASVIAAALVGRFGNLDSLTFDQYVAMLTSQGRLGGGDPTALAVAFRTLGESLAYAASQYASKPVVPSVAAVGVAAVTWTLAWRATCPRAAPGARSPTPARAVGPCRRGLAAAIFVVAALAPLALVPVGHDLGRWLALSMANTLMAVALVSRATSREPDPRLAWLVLLGAAGPLGANIVLPWWT
jgi:hypothetical protein